MIRISGGRRDRQRPIRRFAAALFIGFVGLAFAAFFASPQLRGFVQGDASGDWGTISCFEFHTWDQGIIPASADDAGADEYLGKEVATLNEPVLVADDTYVQVLQISVDNAYPSYGVRCSIGYEIEDGQVAELTAVTLTPLSGLSGDGCAEITDMAPNPPEQLELACDELTVRFTPGQLVCDTEGEVENDLIFHVEQAAQQESTISFQVALTPVQCVQGISAATCDSAPLQTTLNSAGEGRSWNSGFLNIVARWLRALTAIQNAINNALTGNSMANPSSQHEAIAETACD